MTVQYLSVCKYCIIACINGKLMESFRWLKGKGLGEKYAHDKEKVDSRI